MSSSGGVLSFDEFNAMRLREKAKSENPNPSSQKPFDDSSSSSSMKKKATSTLASKKPKESSIEPPSSSNSSLSSIGDFIEMHETQTFCIALIILDSYLAHLLSMLTLLVSDMPPDNTKMLLESLIPILNTSTTFTQIYFVFELAIIFMSFGIGVLGHLGYSVDFIIISTQFYYDLKTHGRGSRVLNIVRLWRVYRLLMSLVNVEKEAHEATKELLEDAEAAVKKMEIERGSIEDDLKREREARTSVEAMLQDYKEEVDTLNEALKIAARDVAEVAETEDDIFDSDDEEALDQESEAVDDSASVSVSQATKASASTRASKSSALTFVVHSDGTYEQR